MTPRNSLAKNVGFADDTGSKVGEKNCSLKTMGSTRKSTAMRPINSIAGRTLCTMPGETKKTSSCAS